jgi:4-hydroxy-4-methyl-2-oxoglutarate aldolase
MATDDGQSLGWVDRLAGLYTPVVADVLDRLGRREQCLRADIRPLFPGARAAGVARTVRTTPAPEVAPAEPYKR